MSTLKKTENNSIFCLRIVLLNLMNQSSIQLGKYFDDLTLI